MKRRDFLRKLGIGVAVVPAIPLILSEVAQAEPVDEVVTYPSKGGGASGGVSGLPAFVFQDESGSWLSRPSATYVEWVGFPGLTNLPKDAKLRFDTYYYRSS